MRLKPRKKMDALLTSRKNWKSIFNSQNKSFAQDATSIPATFLRCDRCVKQVLSLTGCEILLIRMPSIISHAVVAVALKAAFPVQVFRGV
jgi:hypothetical protein